MTTAALSQNGPTKADDNDYNVKYWDSRDRQLLLKSVGKRDRQVMSAGSANGGWMSAAAGAYLGRAVGD